jgi:hypothetical protein
VDKRRAASLLKVSTDNQGARDSSMPCGFQGEPVEYPGATAFLTRQATRRVNQELDTS